MAQNQALIQLSKLSYEPYARNNVLCHKVSLQKVLLTVKTMLPHLISCFKVMDTLANDMNYTLDIQAPPNGEKWGENNNGSLTGLVGQLQKGISDIGWADLWVLPEWLVYCHLI